MPTIETERLRLRPLTNDDFEDLHRLLSDPDVVRYVGSGKPLLREETETALTSIISHWERHGFGRWAVIYKETGEFVGFGGLRMLIDTPEVVYHLTPRFWGKGLATEIAKAALRYGFAEHDFPRIVAIAKPANLASVHVMEKIGMHYEMHTSYYNIDVVQYSLMREQFVPDASFYRLLKD